jgi:hypothetical protein
MNRFSALIYSRASLANLILAIMVIIPLNALVFPLMSGHFKQLTSGMQTLDVQMGYFPAQAGQQIAAYGDAARSYYLLIEWTADLIYPFVYTSVFTLLLAFILKASLDPDHPFRSLVLLPGLMMVADYLENISISIQLLFYPHPIPILEWVSAVASILKWLFGGFVLLGLLISLVFLVRRLVKPNDSHHEGG